MTVRHVRFRPRRPAEPPPALAIYPPEPIVPDEITGRWSIWHEDEGYPSHACARDAWLRRHGDPWARQ